MHPGLIEGPFVPHNLKSAQYSSVPLPQFQMAPRFKILMSSGSKKVSQIYFPFFSKRTGKRIPSKFPNGAPMEGHICLQVIFTYLLIYLFITKALRKDRPSIFPKCGAPIPRAVHSSSPVYEPPPCRFQVPLRSKGAPMERYARIQRLS